MTEPRYEQMMRTILTHLSVASTADSDTWLVTGTPKDIAEVKRRAAAAGYNLAHVVFEASPKGVLGISYAQEHQQDEPGSDE